MTWKQTSFYKELRHIYRAFFHYREPLAYLYNRFFVRPRIRKLNRPIDRPSTDPSYSVHLLCSHADLDMLLWSLASWYEVVPESGQVYVHEDGSFTKEDQEIVLRLLPNAKLIDYVWATKQATADWLKDMPHAKEYREHANELINSKRYVFAIKLVDPRFISDAPARLLLDTDILWFKHPAELLQRLKAETNPFFLEGKSNLDFQFADGTYLADNLSLFNAGVIGYNLRHYQLPDLERFCAKMGPNTNPYFMEQAGHSWILSQNAEIRPLESKNHVIEGILGPDLVVKHYTGPRREQYWYEGVACLKSSILKS
jgi:hypothetical protein